MRWGWGWIFEGTRLFPAPLLPEACAALPWLLGLASAMAAMAGSAGTAGVPPELAPGAFELAIGGFIPAAAMSTKRETISISHSRANSADVRSPWWRVMTSSIVWAKGMDLTLPTSESSTA